MQAVNSCLSSNSILIFFGFLGDSNNNKEGQEEIKKKKFPWLDPFLLCIIKKVEWWKLCFLASSNH